MAKNGTVAFSRTQASFLLGKHSLPIVTLLWAGDLVRQGQRDLS